MPVSSYFASGLSPSARRNTPARAAASMICAAWSAAAADVDLRKLRYFVAVAKKVSNTQG